MHNSKFWSILFFAFRFNFSMSQDPDSTQSPEQVSDFDVEAWFRRNRCLQSASHQSRARAAHAWSRRLRAWAAAENRTAGVFFAEFLHGGDLSFYE